jgi:hypothetical protein
MTLPGRDVADIDALVTDRYLDSLLGANRRGAEGGEGGPTPRRLESGVRLASDRLVRDLPRFHPSFRFEERLAVRLAEAAAAMRLSAAVGAEGAVPVIPFPAPELPVGFDPLADAPHEGFVIGSLPRPLLIGGAVAASAISLAGAAYVAWRRTRPGGSPMARAARAAHAMRERPVQEV